MFNTHSRNNVCCHFRVQLATKTGSKRTQETYIIKYVRPARLSEAKATTFQIRETNPTTATR